MKIIQIIVIFNGVVRDLLDSSQTLVRDSKSGHSRKSLCWVWNGNESKEKLIRLPVLRYGQ